MEIINENFFGLYLLRKNYITLPILYKSIEVQRILNKKLGDLAIELKILEPEKVTEVYNEQKRTNALFGEIAKKKNFLTEEQLDNLIKTQKEKHVFLGEIFNLLGYITNEELEKEVNAFTNIELIRKEKLEKEIKNYGREYSHLENIIYAAKNTFYRMMFLELKFSTEFKKQKIIYNKSDLVKINFSGDMNFEIYYNFDKMFSDDVIFNFFKTLPKKQVLSMRNSILVELANIVSGVIITDLDKKKNLNIDISIPHKIEEISQEFIDDVLVVTLLSPYGELDLCIKKN